MADPNVRLALRIHDECNGELVLFLRPFASGTCSCDLWGSTAGIFYIRISIPGWLYIIQAVMFSGLIFAHGTCKPLSFNAMLRIELQYFRCKVVFSPLLLSYNNRSANYQKSSTAVLTWSLALRKQSKKHKKGEAAWLSIFAKRAEHWEK